MIYDRVMRGVDYDTWAEYLLNLAVQYEFDHSSLCDLACGTGSMALVLAFMAAAMASGVCGSTGMGWPSVSTQAVQCWVPSFT